MDLKHTRLGVGTLFYLTGLKDSKGKVGAAQLCRKNSLLGYIVVGEEMLGEVQFTVDNDTRIEPILTPGAAVVPADPHRLIEEVDEIVAEFRATHYGESPDKFVNRPRIAEPKRAPAKMKAKRVTGTG